MFWKKKKSKRSIIEHAADVSSDPIFITDSEGVFIWVNKEFEKLYGYSREIVIGKHTSNIIKSDKMSDKFFADLWNTISTGNPWKGKIINKDFEGNLHHVNQTIIPVFADDDTSNNKPEYYVASHNNISDLIIANEALHKKTTQLEAAQRIAGMGYWQWSVETNMFEWSEELFNIYNMRDTHPLPMSDYLTKVHQDDQHKVIRLFNISQSRRDTFDIDHRVIVDGEIKWLHSEANVEYNDDGIPVGLFGITHDVTERYKSEERITWLANHDPLTRLPNRNLFNKRIGELIGRNREADDITAILLLDLDHFKEVNDSMGHDCGDELLIQVSARLQDCVRERDLVSRLGGDEFAVLLDNISGYEGASTASTKIIDALKEPYIIMGQKVHINSSIGITLCPEDGNDPTQLFKQADLALYKAKDEGRGQFRFFVDELNAVILRRKELETHLRRAVKNSELEVYLQPKVNLLENGIEIKQAEALLRWISPELGFISPGEFIPVAETSGLIGPISNWLLEDVLEKIKEIHKITEDFKLSVNISPNHLKQSDFCQQIEDRIVASGVSTKHLEFEITENLLLDNTASTLSKLNYLADLGIAFSIDDFGTGYSSLGYLKKFPVSCLKIDKSFIDDIGKEDDDETIVKAVSNLATSLGMDIVAEGVETEQQLEFLKLNTECKTIQGYYFSKPLPFTEFKNYLKDQTDAR